MLVLSISAWGDGGSSPGDSRDIVDEYRQPPLMAKVNREDGLVTMVDGQGGSASSADGLPSDQIAHVPVEKKKDLTSFFIIGAGINLIGMALFFVWAAGEWRKKK